MRLVVSTDDFKVELEARTKRGLNHMTALAIGLVKAGTPEGGETEKLSFGFEAGSGLITEIVPSIEQPTTETWHATETLRGGRWPVQAATRRRRTRRP